MDAGPPDSVYFINHNTTDANRNSDIDHERSQNPAPHFQSSPHPNAFGSTQTYIVKRTHHKNKSIKTIPQDESHRNIFPNNQPNRSHSGFDTETAILSNPITPAPIPANNDSRQQNLEPKMKLEIRKDITRGVDYK
jgi:hypothetical protein